MNKQRLVIYWDKGRKENELIAYSLRAMGVDCDHLDLIKEVLKEDFLTAYDWVVIQDGVVQNAGPSPLPYRLYKESDGYEYSDAQDFVPGAADYLASYINQITREKEEVKWEAKHWRLMFILVFVAALFGVLVSLFFSLNP